MTLQERIEDYIGSFSDVSALDAWLTLAVRRVMMIVPIRFLESSITPLSVPASGLPLQAIRLQSVVSNGVPLAQLPVALKTKAQDPRSLFYASKREPTFYVENGKLFVLPLECSVYSTAFAVVMPQVTHVSNSLGVNVEPEIEHAVILFVAIQGRMRQLNNHLALYVTALSLPERAVPVAPDLPSFFARITDAASAASVTIDTVPLDLPDFPLPVMPPVYLDFTLPEAPSIAPPAPPSYAGVSSLTARTVPPPGNLDLATELTALGKSMSEEDVELSQGYLAAIRAKLENHVQQHELWIKSMQAGSEVERAYIESTVAEYRARVDAFTAEMNGYVTQIRVGLDYYSARAGIIQAGVTAAVEKFKGETEGLLGVYRGKLDAYTAQVNRAIQAASLEQNRLIENARLSEAASARASQEEAARQLNEYKLILERYQGEVQGYSVGVQADAQGMLAQVQKAKVDFDGMAAGLVELKNQFMELMQSLIQRV